MINKIIAFLKKLFAKRIVIAVVDDIDLNNLDFAMFNKPESTKKQKSEMEKYISKCDAIRRYYTRGVK